MPEQLTMPEQQRAARRFGVHALLAFVAVALVAIPFSIIVLLVTAKTDPLVHLDHDAANSLHTFAISHPNVTEAMKVIGVVASPPGGGSCSLPCSSGCSTATCPGSPHSWP